MGFNYLFSIAPMAWTHIYDLILKLLSMFLAIVLVSAIQGLEEHPASLFALILLLFAAFYILVARTLGSYLYCRFSLKMPVTLKQAQQLNNAFSPFLVTNSKWLPMRELKTLDHPDKFGLALANLQAWKRNTQEAREQKHSNFKTASLKTKALTVVMLTLVVYFLIAGFFNLPPADAITMAYCQLFNTTRYYPFLEGMLLVLPTVLIFKAIDKNIQ